MTSYLGSSRWKPALLQDLVFLQRGFDITKAQQTEGAFPVISSSGFTSFHNEAMATGPGVIIGRKGSLGTVHYSEDDYWPHDTTLWSKSLNGNIPRFVYYALMCLNLERFNVGGANPTLNRNHIHSLPINLPDKDTQRRITAALCPIDDLIKNNRRRIALLERAARLLYEEWFVCFRFPGHEHAKFVNGLPKGWAEQHLAELCDGDDGIQTGPFGSQLHQSDYSDDGVPVVMPKNMIAFRIVSDGIARIPEQIAERLSRHRMVEGDTVYGRRGDIGRRAYISEREVGWLCGTGCLRMRPNNQKIDPRFLFDALGAPKTAGTIANRAKGATLPNLNSTILRSVPVLVPSRSMQDLYSAQIRPIKGQIETLAAYNEKLGAARDLLLPRLMSGEVAV